MGDYESAVEHRQRLLGTLEGAEKVRMLLELGSICRDRLQDPYPALDADPKMVQAFAELETLLTARKRWRDLEGAYVRMIQRLPKGPEAAAGRIALWKILGELYRRVLNDVEGARMAFEVAAKADPGDAAALEAHAELAGKCRGREAEAIEAYRRLLKIGNAPQPAVSALIGLQAELKRYDEAYAAAQTLAFILGGGTTEEGHV